MLVLTDKDKNEIRLEKKYTEHIGLFYLDDYFQDNENEEGGDKVLAVDFAGEVELQLVSNCLVDLSKIINISKEISMRSNLDQFLQVLRIAQYLQFEELREGLLSSFYNEINTISLEGNQIPEYFRVLERANSLRNYLGMRGESDLTTEQNKEMVFNCRHLNGQKFPQIMKFEEFYCRDVLKSDNITITEDDRRESLSFEF